MSKTVCGGTIKASRFIFAEGAGVRRCHRTSGDLSYERQIGPRDVLSDLEMILSSGESCLTVASRTEQGNVYVLIRYNIKLFSALPVHMSAKLLRVTSLPRLPSPSHNISHSFRVQGICHGVESISAF